MPSQPRAPKARAGDNRSVQLNGERVRALRRQKGMSRVQLGDSTRGTPYAITEVTITRIERGDRVYASTAGALAWALGVPLLELLAEGEGDDLTLQPTIAVMPLRAPDERTTDFACGLAEDLLTRISRWWFPVLARASTIDAASTDPQATARALGASYWIEGVVRRAGSHLDLTARLCDARTGTVVTSYPYEGKLADVFAHQERLASSIVADLYPHVLDHAARRFEGYDPSDLEAWQQALVGAACFYRRNAEDNARARELMAAALRRDARMPLAWYTLALSHQQDLINQWTTDARSSIAQLDETSREFERHYPRDAWAHVARAYHDVYAGHRDTAMARLRGAIDADPNTCLAYALYGQTLAMASEPDHGIEQFEVALQLNPRDTERWSTYTGMALAHFVAERYEQSVQLADKALGVRPSAAFPYAVLASAHAHLGQLPEARRALHEMHAIQPNMSSSGIVSIMSSTEPDIGKRYLEGLRRAGMPS